MPDRLPGLPRLAWRSLVRSLHRDLGYLAVGLTVVYALSGLAVNHVAEWDSNFQAYRAIRRVSLPLPADAGLAAAAVARQFHFRGPVRESYRAAPDQLEVMLDGVTLHVNPVSGRVVEEGRKPRPFFRIANWLHLNRGKRAWTVVADLYAVGLLLLSLSGLFMLPGRNGIRGRGAVLALIGAVVPVLYVLLSGGPGR